MNKWKWHCISCKTSPVMMNSLSFIYSPFGKHSFAGCSILVWQFFFSLSQFSVGLLGHMLLSPSPEAEVWSCISLSLSALLQVLWSSNVPPSSLVLFSKPEASRDLEYIMSHQCSEAGERYQSSGSPQKRWNAGYMFPCMMRCTGERSMGSECLETMPLFSVTTNPVLFLNSA